MAWGGPLAAGRSFIIESGPKKNPKKGLANPPGPFGGGCTLPPGCKSSTPFLGEKPGGGSVGGPPGGAPKVPFPRGITFGNRYAGFLPRSPGRIFLEGGFGSRKTKQSIPQGGVWGARRSPAGGQNQNLGGRSRGGSLKGGKRGAPQWGKTFFLKGARGGKPGGFRGPPPLGKKYVFSPGYIRSSIPQKGLLGHLASWVHRGQGAPGTPFWGKIRLNGGALPRRRI